MLGSGFGGQYGILGSNQFGSLGQSSNITNVTVADVIENLTPRSSVTAAASYGLMHFTDNTQNLINSQQYGGQAGFDHSLSAKDQIAVTGSYMAFHFPGVVGADDINTERGPSHVWAPRIGAHGFGDGRGPAVDADSGSAFRNDYTSYRQRAIHLAVPIQADK